MAQAEEIKIRKYLLGQLTEAEEEQIEFRLLTEPDFADEYDIVVNEVTDDYVAGKFEGEELKRLEEDFFKSTQRRDKLKFALALNAPAVKKLKAELDAKRDQKRRFRRYLEIAAALALLAGGGFYVWRVSSNNSDLNKGLAALQSAFREERPLEARLSDFSYAPATNQRGGEPAKVDYVQRDRAATLLLNAVSEHPSAASHHALGKYYLAEHQFDNAIDQFQIALSSDPKNAKIHSDLGAAFMEKGKLENSEPDKGKAIEDFAKSLEHLNTALGLSSDPLEAYFNRALVSQYMMAPEQAEAAWKVYLQRDANSPWAEEARRNLKRLEEDRRRTSRKTDDALKDFLEARRAGDDNGAWKVLSQNYTSAGNEITNQLIDSVLEEGVGRSKDSAAALPALSYLAELELRRARDRYTSDLVKQYEHSTRGMRQLLADAHRHMKLGYALFTQSKFKEAVVEYANAKLGYERVGDAIEKTFVEYRLAHCYVFFDLEKANLAFRLLATTCTRDEYRWLLAQCLSGLAHASADNSEYSKAIDYGDRALAGFEESGDLNGTLKCLTQLADFNQALNRVGISLTYLSRGLVLAYETSAEPMQRWGILNQLGLSMSSMQLNVAALFYQKEALGLALEMGRPLIISRSHGYVGSAYAAMKMYPEAVNEASSAFEIGQSNRESTGGQEIMANASQQLGDIRREAGQCNRALKDYDTSIQLYSNLKVDYYRYMGHRGKLLCFIAESDNQAAGKELETVLDLSDSYRRKITSESQRNSFFDMEQSVYDLAIYYESARMKDPVKAFEYSERSRARSLLDAVQRGAEVRKKGNVIDLNLPTVTKSKSLAKVQAGMPTNAQILQYVVLDDRLLMWVVTKSRIQPEEVLVGAQPLTDKVRAYLEAVKRIPTGDEADQPELAAELYSILIAPAEPFLDKSKVLCIVPDKILHYLPYGALVSPATIKYLIEDYDLNSSPSSSIFVDLSAAADRKAGRLDERLLSIGNPHFSRTSFDLLRDLPAAAREARAVSDLYDRHQLLLYDEARESIIKAEMEKADVAHFAMHYVQNGQSEMLSGFPLTPEHSTSNGAEKSDGFLQSYEIYRMKLPRMRLVILSGCSTGIERQYRGEGAVGVARPFLVAGVPTVVASLWPVDSDSSAELMTSFHRHRLRDQLPVTQALARAQREMIHGEDLRYRHPYYWAPFLAIGGLSPY